MDRIWSQLGVAILSFILLDAVWLGFVMNGFYKRHLAPVARMSGGILTPIWPAAALVYPLLAVGIVVFVVARARSPLEALTLGMLLGLVIYGVYDMTNLATLREYPVVLAVVDIAWGAVLCGSTAWITATLTRAG